MICTEEYKKHIEYTFNGFRKVVIRYAAINAWQEREISFEYLTEEKFYPFSTLDKYFIDPRTGSSQEYHVWLGKSQPAWES